MLALVAPFVAPNPCEILMKIRFSRLSTLPPTLSLLALLAASSPAMAQDTAACLSAASKGQKFRDAHKLVEARDEFRVCAAAGCPGVVQSDCANWLVGLEKATPTLVVTAKSGAGENLVDVKVTVDGQPFEAKLDGRAVPIDPGTHAFRFEGPDGSTVDEVVVVTEGEQNQRVNVVIGPVPPPGTAGAAATGAAEGGSRSTWRNVGWVVGGVGIVGLGIGAAFGISAISNNNSSNANGHCDATGCDATGTSLRNDAISNATASTITFIAGGVLTAAGIVLVVVAPVDKKATTGTLEVRPLVGWGQGATGLSLAGSW